MAGRRRTRKAPGPGWDIVGRCPRCRFAMHRNEVETYGDQCENCWVEAGLSTREALWMLKTCGESVRPGLRRLA